MLVTVVVIVMVIVLVVMADDDGSDGDGVVTMMIMVVLRMLHLCLHYIHDPYILHIPTTTDIVVNIQQTILRPTGWNSTAQNDWWMK